MTKTLNVPAAGVPYFTPRQSPPAGTAYNPQRSGTPVPKLFQPLTIRGVEFPNRIFLSPLCQYSADNGVVTPWHMAHLGGIFTRGAGLTVIEATAVLPEGRITPEDVGIWTDEQAEALSKITAFAHAQNQKIGIQLAHAGRKASCVAPWVDAPPLAPVEEGGWPDNVWAPSAIQFMPGYPEPKELTLEGIKKIIQAFVDGAKRAVAAGFDVIEVHSAHGYLLSSFLSPTSNKRTDQYGGSFENRTRLIVEIVDAIRAVVPETMPVFVRVSGTEWLEVVAPEEPSWTVEDTARLAPILADHGVDLLDVSAGGIDARQKIRPGPEYQVPFATAAKKAVAGTKMLVSAVGGLYQGKVAAKILEDERADVIFVGRMFQRNPGLVWDMADDCGIDLHWANQIGWGFRGRGIRFLGTNDKKVAEAKKL